MAKNKKDMCQGCKRQKNCEQDFDARQQSHTEREQAQADYDQEFGEPLTPWWNDK